MDEAESDYVVRLDVSISAPSRADAEALVRAIILSEFGGRTQIVSIRQQPLRVSKP